jgi:class 3 adenylate cyclase/alpha-beta hydrolase superfamily lysophospholipase
MSMARGDAVRYATTPDGTQLAYQVFGQGTRDLLLVWGGISHIELLWDDPTLDRIFRRLGTFARVIQFDRRGTGMSDRPATPATIEQRMEDALAVLDAAGSTRACVLGESEGSPPSCLLAATHPSRVSGLILYGPVIRMIGDKGFPWAPTREVFDDALEATTAAWGSEDLTWAWAPSAGEDPRAREFVARFVRLSSSPSAYRDQMRLNAAIDVRSILPMIAVPTLVCHRRDDSAINVGQGRYAASHIPDAEWVELMGDDHLLIAGDPEPLLDAIEVFMTGIRSEHDVNGFVTTVAFTDIVDSTQIASRLGDQRWRELLDNHDAILRTLLRRFSGREVNTTGDGMVASFEGPARAVEWARAVVHAARDLGIEVRAGVHTGACEIRGKDLAGVAVHVAARISALAGPGEVLMSQTVRDLLPGSGIAVSERGSHTLKGLDRQWLLFAVYG